MIDTAAIVMEATATATAATGATISSPPENDELVEGRLAEPSVAQSGDAFHVFHRAGISLGRRAQGCGRVSNYCSRSTAEQCGKGPSAACGRGHQQSAA